MTSGTRTSRSTLNIYAPSQEADLVESGQQTVRLLLYEVHTGLVVHERDGGHVDACTHSEKACETRGYPTGQSGCSPVTAYHDQRAASTLYVNPQPRDDAQYNTKQAVYVVPTLCGVLLLLHHKDVVVEQVLQLLVGVVDAQLRWRQTDERCRERRG